LREGREWKGIGKMDGNRNERKRRKGKEVERRMGKKLVRRKETGIEEKDGKQTRHIHMAE
jgi:hypothetical protein